MPAKTSRRHRQGLESRQRILESALAIAAERGYDGTTVALITERAQVPASSVYWQFANKDDLLAAALEHSYRSWRRDGPTWQPANYTGDIRERIGTRLENSLRAVEKQPEYWRLGLMVSLRKRSIKITAQESFLAVRVETRQIIDEWWQTMLPSGIGDQERLVRTLTHCYLALVDGLFVAHSAQPDRQLDDQTDILAEAMAHVVSEWFANPNVALSHEVAAPGQRKSEPRGQSEVDSKTKLLIAAEEIAANSGYRGTTISKICKQAGLPASSVYWFFEDKSDLMAAVVQRSWDEWFASQPGWDDPEPDQSWADALRNILNVSSRSLVDAPLFMRIGHLLTLEHAAEDVPARNAFIKIREGIEEQIAAWFERNLPTASTTANPALPSLLARSVIVFTDGYFIASQIDRALVPVPDFVEFVVDVLEWATISLPGVQEGTSK